jgi:hypothetical protein
MSDGKRVPASAGDEARADRLAQALRANLKRRKAQARAKDEAGPQDGTPEAEISPKSGENSA